MSFQYKDKRFLEAFEAFEWGAATGTWISRVVGCDRKTAIRRCDRLVLGGQLEAFEIHGKAVFMYALPGLDDRMSAARRV